MDESITSKEILERFAAINEISIEEAQAQLNTTDVNEMLENIKQLNLNKIREQHPLNRAQRRALAKKMGKKKKNQAELISDTAEKLNYIDLIQKLRELNEKNKEVEENEENN